ncbi:MAG TPA: TonB family protein [Puia sp.]|nr:TonB family protein [Puia sp.]
MKPEMILQADVLDIIFDNRNKEYGAYELRSHYEERLKKSVIITFVFLSFFVLMYCWFNHSPGGISHHPFLPDDLTLTQVHIEKPVVQHEIHQPPHPQVATIQNTRYLIVPDQFAPVPPPTVDQLDINKIGTETKSGDFTGDIVLTPSDESNKAINTNSNPVTEEPSIIDHPEVMPEFPGGEDALMRFLSKNLRMPRQDMEPGSRIATLVKFVVGKDGYVNSIEFEKSGGKDFDNEVIRVMKKMPAWKPGKQNGKNVAVYFKLPVTFTVPDEN